MCRSTEASGMDRGPGGPRTAPHARAGSLPGPSVTHALAPSGAAGKEAKGGTGPARLHVAELGTFQSPLETTRSPNKHCRLPRGPCTFPSHPISCCLLERHQCMCSPQRNPCSRGK